MTKRLDKAGFSLVEILAAMAVLMIVVLMLTRVFRDATSAWTIGTRQMEDNINGRAVLDFIARDISTAIAGESNCVFYLKSSNASWPHDELSFVSFSGVPSPGNREARQIVYYVANMTDQGANPIPDRYCLRRIMQDGLNTITCYTDKDWWNNVSKAADDPVVAENINLFRIWCTGTAKDASGNTYWTNNLSDYDTSLITDPVMKGKLPVYIDLYLEMLGEDAAIKVAQLRSANLLDKADALVTNSVKKYMTRVYFANRTGYAMDQTP